MKYEKHGYLPIHVFDLRRALSGLAGSGKTSGLAATENRVQTHGAMGRPLPGEFPVVVSVDGRGTEAFVGKAGPGR